MPTTSCKQTSLIGDVMWTDMNFALGGLLKHLAVVFWEQCPHFTSQAYMKLVLWQQVLKSRQPGNLSESTMVRISQQFWWSDNHVEWANTGWFYMPPREASAVRPLSCKLLGFPALSNDNSRTQLIALSTAYPWYSLNIALQSAAPYKITKRAKTKHRYYNFTSVSSLLKYPFTLRCTHVHWPMP